MRGKDRPSRGRLPTVVVAPTLSRARAAIRQLSAGRRGPLEPATLPDLFARRRVGEVMLCPEGKDLARDLSFLRQAGAGLPWREPDDDLRAAIAGLRGEEVGPLSGAVLRRPVRERRLALLLEGTVTAGRARQALASDVRLWIVESPAALRLSAAERGRLAKAGVVWFALEPARVIALVASRDLARARRLWRELLPPRTKVIVFAEKPRAGKP